jgi:methyl-accepting chemotaxis protein
VIGTALPQTLPVWASAATRVEITLLFSLALFLVIMLGVNIANVITRPLRQLVLASEQVAEGDLTVQVTPKGSDEISMLTQSFNQMVHSLSDSKMDLLKAYDSTLVGWSNALELRDQETEGHPSECFRLGPAWMGVLRLI